MIFGTRNWIFSKLQTWLTKRNPRGGAQLCNFERLCYEIRPGDVLLVEGNSRVSSVIKQITQSNWTHAALYIGRLYDIDDETLRNRVQAHYDGDPNEQLVIEALLGKGTIVAPVSQYKDDHLRICRPTGLSPADVPVVIEHNIERLGADYDVRHLLDLARFFFPWSIFPRRWRSSLFEHGMTDTARAVCSCIIAEGFTKVQFPILPFVGRNSDGEVRMVKRNPRLFTPKDFDHSPYFDIIKYPYLGPEDIGLYRRLPWSQRDIVFNDDITEQGLPEDLAIARRGDEIESDASKDKNPDDDQEPSDAPKQRFQFGLGFLNKEEST